MNKKKIYSLVSGASTLVGIGMLLGYSLARGTSKNPLWIGGILIFIGAVTLGMAISSRELIGQVKESEE
jgi:hypothetical protein